MGYPKSWDHSRDPWKKNSIKISAISIVETKMEDNVAQKSTALIATADNDIKVLNIYALVSNST